jgi:glycosyltransferase involved in cell wall biosynthesis/2-polyprenyl-3-methyl-5-hydroxy-6-metoxy-1,4-benzoquinol methylase
MVSVCAIIASNYLPYARVLADSFFAHHPDGSLTVLVVDDEDRRMVPDDPRIEWRRLADIGVDAREIHRLAGIYDVTELSTAVKPLLLRRLLDEGRREVIFLDPDIRLYAPLDDVIALADRHGIVLTPHTTRPFPRDGRQVDARFVLGAGVYNLGFIAVSAAARPFLDWWAESTRREALIDFARAMFADQRWIDYAPCLFEPHILKDPGYNVAYWNLHERDVTQEDGQYRVDAAQESGAVPLRFFHFSGFDVQKPWLLSRHQGDRPRVLLSERPVLARLCRDYVACLERAGLEVDETPTYGWQTAAAGFELSPRMRRLYWHGVVAFEEGRAAEPADPFDAENPRAFLDWLNTPDEDGPPRVSRYLYSIYRDRADLRLHFPDLAGGDASRYAEWVWRYGVQQEPALFDLFELLPPRDDDEAEAQLEAQSGAGGHAVPALVAEGDVGQLLAAGIEAARIAGGLHDLQIICRDPEGTRRFVHDAGPHALAGRHRIGYWLWDVDPFPASLYAAFDDVDEVWVPTDYVADILSTPILQTGRRKPVFIVPLPMPVPAAPAEITRERLGLPDRFLFLQRVDLASDLARTNPLGAIEAFSAAFLPDQGPLLVIEILNGERHVPALEQIRMAAAGRRDVHLLERALTADEQNALLGICDCYVSLHRAEALGLTIAKAMAVGKPAIATGFSGNLHFMTPDNSYLVDGTPSLAAGVAWVDPDVDHAAQLMREVYDRPFDAACKARRGQADVFERHGLWTSASAIRHRIDDIRRERRLAAEPEQPEAPAEVLASATEVQPLEQPVSPSTPPDAAPAEAPRDEMPFAREPMPAGLAADDAASKDQTSADQTSGEQTSADSVFEPEAVRALEALVPELERLGVPRLSAEGRALPGMRMAAQRALFRVIQPYAFQQRQFQDALIGALLSSVRTLEGEVRTLSGELQSARGEAAAGDTRIEARLAETQVRLTEAHARLAGTDARLEALAAADAQAEASLAALSARLFVAPFDPGRERFLQRAPNGDTRLGYGSTNGARVSEVNGHAVLHAPLFRVRQRLYLPLLKHRARVLDIGCGRGAMLDLLRVARVPAVGIDFDPAMVSHCRANGHTVEQADALQFLRAQPDGSVGAIFSARLLEHLAFDQLQEFLQLCRTRLELGGLLIAETTNPRDLTAIADRLSGAVPPQPISPELALALCQHAGFEQAHVLFPTGTGVLDPDRQAQPHYAVLATAGGATSS